MFQLPIFIIIFLFGLAVGSFLNSVIYRLEKSKGKILTFLTGRSFCPHCQHVLSWLDLIPIFSFIFLKGKCRYCQKKISWQYPLVEFTTGFFFLFPFILQSHITLYSSIFEIGFYWIICSFLIIIFVYDLKHYLIPDKVIYPAIFITFLYQLLGIWNFGNWNFFRILDLWLGILPSLFFLTIIVFSQGKWMGMGDFKLAILMGLFLGFPNILVAMFSTFFLGAIIGTVLIAAGKKTMKSKVPFGPFLVTGTFIAFFWGETIINWYFHLLKFS